MPYCTIDDIRNQLDQARLVQLTDDEGTGAIVEARIVRAINDADEEINGYLGSRVAVPLTAGEALRRLAVDISIYNLYGRRERVPANRMERYRSAIRFLEQVSLGRITLGGSDPEGTPLDPEAPRMSGENPERAFTRASLAGF